MQDKDIDRIIRFHLSPINISVHTTDPVLRCKMLNNRFAGRALKMMDKLYQAGTPMNGQIVLCKGVNDGEQLERSIADLAGYIPAMESLSVVPVGLTKFREGLYPLEPFTRAEAERVIRQIESWQKKLYQEQGTHFVHAGYLPAGHLERLIRLVTERFPGRKIHLYPVANHFFGEQITVAGLLTGQDIIGQLKGKELGTRLLLPACMFRSGEEVFLDDLTRTDVENALQVPVDIVKSSGHDLVEALLAPVPRDGGTEHGPYELDGSEAAL